MMFNAISNSNSLSDNTNTNTSVSSGSTTRLLQDFPLLSHTPPKIKRKRSLPGNPDPDAEVIALSPKTLLATNRFVCEICNKGFQRDQNLQLHRRGHNLPWKLKQRNSNEIVRKRAYVCPEPSCVHHHPSRALGDLTGIKKHFCRKHGEKKWKCDKCSKIYAVQSDWKAHSKTCGTREYRCDCGTIFSRKDSFITHRAFCDALAEESARLSANQLSINSSNPNNNNDGAPLIRSPIFNFPSHNHWDHPQNPNPNPNSAVLIKPADHMISSHLFQIPSLVSSTTDSTVTTQSYNKGSLVINSPPFLPQHVTTTHAATSATALLQKAATIGSTSTGSGFDGGYSSMAELGGSDSVSHASPGYLGFASTWQQKSDRLTRDFLGLQAVDGNGAVNVSVNMKGMLTYAGGVDLQQQQQYERVLRPHHHGFIFSEPASSEAWGNC